VLVGSAELIREARIWRKRLGAGWRQAGVLAAAGLYALEHNIDRLAEDHANARLIAEILADAAPGSVKPDQVETNIVMVRTQPLGFTPGAFTEEMARRGVKLFVFGPGTVRMVTHKDVSADDIEVALEQIGEAVR